MLKSREKRADLEERWREDALIGSGKNLNSMGREPSQKEDADLRDGKSLDIPSMKPSESILRESESDVEIAEESLISSQSLEEYYEEIEKRLYQEYLSSDPVFQKVKYRNFVSRSKGIRNGKRRYRKEWKEIRLIQYPEGGRFRSWDRFPFDEYVSEIMGSSDEEDLKNRIIEIWGY